MPKLIIAGLLLLLAPTPSFAWGAVAHRFIMRQAIDLLPAELKPFFIDRSQELVLRANDPDLWRNVGWEDDPNHFIDFGVSEFGQYPFDALPREYGAAIEKFGMATLKKDGLLPWRAAEEFGNLRRAFEGFTKSAPYAAGDTVLFAAVASHYIQDAHQPFHATINYDGQLTNQSGLHSRFESALFERYESRLAIHPVARQPIANMRDEAFTVLLASYKLVDPILAADKAAVAGKDVYDDEYFEKFFAGAGPILQQRITDSIEATAALITGAWQAAGRPPVRGSMPRTVQKVKPPKSGDRK
jgi:hypothetical protein